jgi:hypothetical protein
MKMKMINKHSTAKRSLLGALTVCAALALSGQLGASGWASAGAPAGECEGDACAQVTVTFDAAKGQYRAKNNSSEQWVQVNASNLVASARACLGPGREDYLELKSLAGAYRAEYAEPRCDAQGVGE